MDWDNIKVFLALSRAGSVRAAAKGLGISHTTVARRIGALEADLEVCLFDRRAEGYTLTGIGERFIARAETIESEAFGLERDIVGRDGKLSGAITVTLAAPLASHLLMSDFARFAALYPNIEIRLAITYDILDLARREADVAIRSTTKPPENLIGRRGPAIHYAAYATHDYLAAHDVTSNSTTASWIGWDDDGENPKWVRQSDHPNVSARWHIPDVAVQVEAAKAALGIAYLPCFLADPIPELARIPPGRSHARWPCWVLTHPDLRATERVRVFVRFIIEALKAKEDLLTGQSVILTPARRGARRQGTPSRSPERIGAD